MTEKKTRRTILHAGFWILYFIYETINASWAANDRFDFYQIHKVWANFPLTMAVVYINFYVLMPRYLYPKKYMAYALSMIGLIVSWALVTRYIGYRFWLPWDKTHMPAQYLAEPKNFFVPIRIARNAFRLYPVLALTMLIKVLRNSYSKEKQLRVAQDEKHKAELSNLRSQIHPHFFFNTLSSLYTLTVKKSDKAPDVVMRMSGLMHYMLYETTSDLGLLEDEITQLKNFVAIEELRFGDRIDSSFQYSGDLNGKKISPLILLPFVENAFKHSLINEANKAWVTIDIKVSGNDLFLTVENSMSAPMELSPRQGIGLANVKARLSLSYPGRH
ncbi:sensor histidine kinase, partial [Chryseosolibacter indicus]